MVSIIAVLSFISPLTYISPSYRVGSVSKFSSELTFENFFSESSEIIFQSKLSRYLRIFFFSKVSLLPKLQPRMAGGLDFEHFLLSMMFSHKRFFSSTFFSQKRVSSLNFLHSKVILLVIIHGKFESKLTFDLFLPVPRNHARHSGRHCQRSVHYHFYYLQYLQD